MRIERQVLFWIAAAVLLILTLAFLRDILLPFVLGIAGAYALSPFVDYLSARGMKRGIASALIVALAAGTVVLLIVLLAPLVFSQAQELAAAIPGQIEQLRGMVESWARKALGPAFPGVDTSLSKAGESIADNWGPLASLAASGLWTGGRALFNFLSVLLITPLVVFYLLIDWQALLDRVDGWLPRDHAGSIRALATEMNDAVAAFIRGQGTVCLVLGAYYALALSAIGLDYGLLVGLATGIMAFVPFVGWALGFMAAGALAVAQSWPDAVPLLLVVAIYLGGMAMDAGFLSPKIVGSKIGLHPVWLIFALIVFSYLFGFIGTLVAVPLAAALAVVARFCLRLYLDSGVYRGAETAETGAAPSSGRDEAA